MAQQVHAPRGFFNVHGEHLVAFRANEHAVPEFDHVVRIGRLVGQLSGDIRLEPRSRTPAAREPGLVAPDSAIYFVFDQVNGCVRRRPSLLTPG